MTFFHFPIFSGDAFAIAIVTLGVFAAVAVIITCIIKRKVGKHKKNNNNNNNNNNRNNNNNNNNYLFLSSAIPEDAHHCGPIERHSPRRLASRRPAPPADAKTLAMLRLRNCL